MTVEGSLVLLNAGLVLIIFGLIFMHISSIKMYDAKEERYIQALLSRDIGQYTASRERVLHPDDPVQVAKNPLEDYYPESEMSDEDFFKNIQDKIENSNV